jgi:hypothetical protein
VSFRCWESPFLEMLAPFVAAWYPSGYWRRGMYTVVFDRGGRTLPLGVFVE